MFAYPLRTAALAAAALVGLSACTSPYGYNGVSVGVGNAGYYDPYYGDYGYGYGAGYGGYGYPGYGFAYAPYWGWYDDCYYPGTGYYVYDRYRRKHRWTDAQRRYWQARRESALATSTTTQPVVIRDNWDDFTRNRSTVRNNRIERQQERAGRTESGQAVRVERRQERAVRAEQSVGTDRVERQTVKAQQETARSERQLTRETRRSEVRAERSSRGSGRGRGATSED